jgi:hypothetical protein
VTTQRNDGPERRRQPADGERIRSREAAHADGGIRAFLRRLAALFSLGPRSSAR